MAMLGRKEPAAQPQSAAGAPRKEGKQVAVGSTSEKPGRLNKLTDYINNIRAELRKVTWPTREETRNLTIVVIGISATLGALLFSLDSLLSFVYRLFR